MRGNPLAVAVALAALEVLAQAVSEIATALNDLADIARRQFRAPASPLRAEFP